MRYCPLGWRLVLFCGLISFLWWPRPVGAHAVLLRAEPEPGAQLSQSPPVIRLSFSESLLPGSLISLHHQDFRPVSALLPLIDPLAPERLETAVPPLEPGIYVVQWMAVSADGHSVTGSYEFGVGQAATPASTGWGSSALWWPTALVATILILATLFVRRWTIRNGDSLT